MEQTNKQPSRFLVKLRIDRLNSKANQIRNILASLPYEEEVSLRELEAKRDYRIAWIHDSYEPKLYSAEVSLLSVEQNTQLNYDEIEKSIDKKHYWKTREITETKRRNLRKNEALIVKTKSARDDEIRDINCSLEEHVKLENSNIVSCVHSILGRAKKDYASKENEKLSWADVFSIIVDVVNSDQVFHHSDNTREFFERLRDNNIQLPSGYARCAYESEKEVTSIAKSFESKRTAVIKAEQLVLNAKLNADLRIKELEAQMPLIDEKYIHDIETLNLTTAQNKTMALENSKNSALKSDESYKLDYPARKKAYDDLLNERNVKTELARDHYSELCATRSEKKIQNIKLRREKLTARLSSINEVLSSLNAVYLEARLEKASLLKRRGIDNLSAHKQQFVRTTESFKDFAENSSDAVLRLEHLSQHFGGVKAVDDLSFDVKEGEIFGLIGPNGAGKTTVFNCITRFYKPTKGAVFFRNKQNEPIIVSNYAVHNVIKEGIVRTFQNVELIYELTVLENLLVGAHSSLNSNIFNHIISGPRTRQENTNFRFKAERVLERLGLLAYKNAYPIGLPYGILKRIELARTLMTNPKLIILDEPAAGLNESETLELSGLIRWIRDEYHCTIFLVEHDMELVMSICDRICAISFGKMLALGTPTEIQNNQLVKEAYLGASDEKHEFTNENNVVSPPAVIKTDSVLKITDLVVDYHIIRALRGINIEVGKGQIVAILGANGSGKSSTLRSISGLVKVKSGSIYLNGKNITNRSAYKIAASGVCQSPEGRQILIGLTVEENLRVGAYAVKKGGRNLDENGKKISDSAYVRQKLAEVYHYFPRLEERKKQQASTLSGGEQQMLAIGRALMGNPEVLLLDEPSLGLAPLIIQDIFSIIKRLKDAGKTILLVEQNAFLTLQIADYAYVLELGQISMQGTGRELLNNEALIEAYLGGKKG